MNIRFVLVIVLILIGGHARAEQTYVCTTLDVFDVEAGRFARSKKSDFWLGAVGQLVVDTRSGAIKIGDQKAADWKIVQKGGANNDFVAMPGLLAPSDSIRLRFFKKPVTFVLMSNGFNFFSGTCEALY
ncbi:MULTISPECIES: hypothetical protein [unclassified Bradyrhizobium]|uniref:hypothetical protein n=1 Tax=unclassified Bradyrhizobium TaxID=2631580 RepID=UPI002FF01CF1